jgi:arabinogalactan endo-1,4-beta-galactosidase
MKNKGVDYDIIGLSYYPYFHGNLNQLETALNTVEKNFDKPIQIVETGYPSQYAIGGSTYDYTSTYPYTQKGQKDFTIDLITLLKNHPRVNGLSWWYPEANAKGCTGDLKNGWYNAGLFNNSNGRALDALYELKRFLGDETGLNGIYIDTKDESAWYSIGGSKLLGKPTSTTGIFINNGHKLLLR